MAPVPANPRIIIAQVGRLRDDDAVVEAADPQPSDVIEVTGRLDPHQTDQLVVRAKTLIRFPVRIQASVVSNELPSLSRAVMVTPPSKPDRRLNSSSVKKSVGSCRAILEEVEPGVGGRLDPPCPVGGSVKSSWP
jgi:hypothetical protein